MARTLCVLAFITSAWLGRAQVTIINTGSTNTPSMNIKLDKSGSRAMVEQRGAAAQKINLAKPICKQLMKDLKAAGPLDQLPEKHCMKSASFGTSLFIEYNGVRSPDLSCPQSDERMDALKKDATAIMDAAKTRPTALHY